MKYNGWKKTAAFVLAFALALGGLPANLGGGGLFGGTAIVASAEDSVTYIDENGTEKTVEATALTSSDDSWTEGWYVVNDEVTIDEHIELQGEVNLILADGATLTANYGIQVGNATLNIYGQSASTGALMASGDDGIRIGNGAITINGGKVTAIGDPGIAFLEDINLGEGMKLCGGDSENSTEEIDVYEMCTYMRALEPLSLVVDSVYKFGDVIDFTDKYYTE